MRVRITILTALAGLLVLVPMAGARIRYSTPVRLGGAPGGGEPSIAVSPRGVVLVAAPQGIPSGLGGTPGTGLWASTNDGRSFGQGRYIGSDLGGGDDDIIFDQGTWYTGDLEAVGTQVCQSKDSGKTWTGVGPVPDPAHCTTVNGGQAAPSDDRPWLTADPTDRGRIYLTYHEFVSAQPVAFVTNNGGGDGFANPCGPLITNPSIETNVPTDVTGGTLVARPAADRQGNLYVLFATTTQQENAAAAAQQIPSGTFSQLYLAVSRDHCRSFTDYTVFDGQKKYGLNRVQFGDIFNDLAIDGAGNLYAVGVGYIGHTPFARTASLYVLSSKDHGQHWSSPVALHTPHAADMLPAAAGGPRAGQLIVGYLRTFHGSTDPNSLKGRWTYSTAESRDATASHPRFTYADVRPGYSYHNGQICNAGILCGLPGEPSDRSLADFTSVALDAHGCALFTFAGNPTGTPSTNGASNTKNYVTRQRTGCFSAHPSHPSSSGSRPHHRRSPQRKHHRRRPRKISRHPKHARGFTG